MRTEDLISSPEVAEGHDNPENAENNGWAPETLSIEPWICADDVAHLLGVSTDWVYEKAVSGDLPSYKFGGHRRFRLSEVENWASGQATGKRAA